MKATRKAPASVEPPSKRFKKSLPPTHNLTNLTNPLQIKPLGNLLFNLENAKTRSDGLGALAVLPDELLLSNIFGWFSGEELVKMQAISRVFFSWSRVEGIWKGVYISKSFGRLLQWYGSWRQSYIATFLRPSPDLSFSTDSIRTPSLHSDVLFQPSLCASFDARTLFLSSSFTPSIPRLDGRGITPSALPHGPVILTNLMTEWAAMSSENKRRRWTLEDMKRRFSNKILFRAEATLTSLESYHSYHERCEMDESPLYLFESHFVEKTVGDEDGGLGEDYEVPECFREDLFQVMEEERPDYRWLIVGPTRSGSTWHQDPNGTAAWNAVTVGAKAWVMFPPDVTPPGVHVSEDQGEVEAPLSLAEWFLSYYNSAKSIYGPKATDPATRGKMKEGICRAGEIFYVPSGWWHIVVNLEPSVAVTQNFVSHRELPAVLKFMRDRPEQVSGFKLVKHLDSNAEQSGLGESDDCVEGVFEKFCEALRIERPEFKEVVDEAESRVVKVNRDEVNGVKSEKKTKGTMWEQVKVVKEEGGFSFGFLGDDDFDEVEL